MNNGQHNAIISFIWRIADDVLRDVYVRGKYRDDPPPPRGALPPGIRGEGTAGLDGRQPITAKSSPIGTEVKGDGRRAGDYLPAKGAGVHTGYLLPRPFTRRELLLLAPAAPLLAQFATGVRVVNVFVTVRDRQGKLVRNLTDADFSLTEDGRKQSIRYFSSDADLPLTLGLLFDLSGSQRAVIPEQREAAAAFLRQMMRGSEDQVLLAGFNQRTRLLEPLTSDRARLEASLLSLEVARDANGQLGQEAQGSALFDALSAAASLLAPQNGRKAVVVISDGIDTASSTRLNAAIEALQRADVLVYPIRVYDWKVFAFDVPGPGTDNLREGKKTLERLSKETGGEFFEVSDAATLSRNFATLEDTLRGQYSLGYAPPAGRAGYRKIRVSVKPRGLTVEARDGYYPALP